jgi:medium-chain acyl-[acyl-carrier-protein] hydrolase
MEGGHMNGMINGSSRWFSRRYLNSSASLRVYCFPCAGGGTAMFDSWPEAVSPWAEICPVLLPGREERIMEPPPTHMAELIPALADGIQDELAERPFAFFGHSMGGYIAFELARELGARGHSAPVHVFLAGCGPEQALGDPRKHVLPDGDFIDMLKTMKGTPREFFDDPDLVDLLLPTIRADFQLAETYVAPPDARLPVPLTAFAGAGDDQVTPGEVALWERHTAATFSLRVVPGDHFAFQASPAVLGSVTQTLQGYCAT